jgi:RNA polymerase sigma-70 factor (ECF subfamily)
MNNLTIENYYRTNFESLVRYIRCIVKDQISAEDIVQETFLRVLCIDLVICPTTLERLIHTIAINIAYDHLRRCKTVSENKIYLKGWGCCCNMETGTLLNINEITEILERGIVTLSEKSQKVYRMEFYERLKPQDIYKITDMNLKQINNILYESRKKIKAFMNVQYLKA